MIQTTDELNKREGEELAGNTEKRVRTTDSDNNEATSSRCLVYYIESVDATIVTISGYVGESG